MKKLKTIIIDDNSESRKLLEKKLKENSNVIEVMALASDVKEGKQLIDQYKPDLVFLEVELPVETGFSLLKEFSNREFEVVLMASHERYAIKAIRNGAFDYLLKPIDENEIKSIVKRLENHEGRSFEAEDQVDEQLTSLSRNKIALANFKGITFVEAERIIHIEAEGSYSKIKFKDEPKAMLISKPLKYFDELLSNQQFLRIHQSHIINMNEVFEYDRGEETVIMSDQSIIRLSRRKKEIFFNCINSLLV